MTYFPVVPDTPRLYAETRQRIGGVIADATGSERVPACPEWTIKDLVAHMTGVCADILGGRLDGVGSESWTQRQVDERGDKSLEDIFGEWNDVGPQVEAIMPNFAPADAQLVMDVVTHEHDIRGALKMPGSRDDEAVRVGLEWLATNLGRELPAVRVKADEGDDLVFGSGDVQATIRAPRFELLRALTGRRSEEQIATFAWEGDYKQHLDLFRQGPFEIATQAIDE